MNMLLNDSPLYVIFKGNNTDWFIPIDNRREGLKWKTVMLTWARSKNIKVSISKILIPSKSNRGIIRFPEADIKIMISNVINCLK